VASLWHEADREESSGKQKLRAVRCKPEPI
jgi:hypothetical protein